MEKLSEGWFPIGTAPRDGTPVILWLIEDETPPEALPPVGFWTLNPDVGIGYWRLFGDPPRVCSDRTIGPGNRFFAFDRQVNKAADPGSAQ